MDTHDPQHDYDEQPSWSPITPTSPTAETEFPDKTAFDVHAFVEEKPATEDSSISNTMHGSSEQIIPGTKAGPTELDHKAEELRLKESKQVVKEETKETPLKDLSEEFKANTGIELKEELDEEGRRELKDELTQAKEDQSESEGQAITQTVEGAETQHRTIRELTDPFGQAVLGLMRLGFEFGDAWAISELDEAMKEMDEMMAKMDEEMGR